LIDVEIECSDLYAVFAGQISDTAVRFDLLGFQSEIRGID
jgi:hypothetical protein